MTDKIYHVPTLLKESVNALNINENGIYVDATFGGGGHSREILSRLKNGKLIAFDRDNDARRNAGDDNRIIFIKNNFRFMHNFLRYYGINKVDGILADLGVSFHHFDESERGFSFRFPEAPLDMRMGRDAALNAATVLNTYSRNQLRQMFFNYGEIKQAERLAGIIVAARELRPFEIIADLIECISAIAPKSDENKFFAKAFQAIRIEVNKEMISLKHFLEQTVNVLNKKGRLSIISYHSLEDRMVKNFFKTGNIEGVQIKDFYGNELSPFVLINKKAIVPDEQEMQNNSRSRSAKLRIAEKK
ncbi:MAG: 16S rRNA (cytosine(1402)-N(4))-methyltransferase RsmH [Prevotellaceae bacterium]|jgi:16S rRNA (cytosine1402-N4)-methyltransferase|nr:16S rRNA (cytosine(1402)-N(4))-methyltransferase RsmH [Prevotellaceae bacterium]